MKTKCIFNFITACIMAVGSIIIGCTESNIDVPPTENTSVISKELSEGEQAANLHNQCLEQIQKAIVNQSRSSIADLKETIKTTAMSFYQSYSRTGESTIEFDEEIFKPVTIESISNIVTENEMQYINAVLNGKIEYDVIIENIRNDNKINEKEALISFVTTYENSLDYWSENKDKWENTILTPSSRASALQNIALADAWWVFQGMSMSFGNIYAAAAVGAAASAGTAIWG